MIRGVLIVIGLIELAGAGLALGAVVSDIQIIIALAAFGFGVTHLGLAAVLNRLPLGRGTA